MPTMPAQSKPKTARATTKMVNTKTYTLKITRVEPRQAIKGLVYIGIGLFVLAAPTLFPQQVANNILPYVVGVWLGYIGIKRLKERTHTITIQNVTNHEKEVTIQDVINQN